MVGWQRHDPIRAVRQRRLPLLPLRSIVLFPGSAQPIDLGRSTSIAAVRAASEPSSKAMRHVVVATQREPMVERPHTDDLYPIGVMGELVQVLQGMPGRMTAVVRGLYRVHIKDVIRHDDHLEVEYERAIATMGDPTLAYALAGALQDLVKQHDNLLPRSSRSRQQAQALGLVLAERTPGRVADLSAVHIDLEQSDRISVLLERQVSERLRQVIELISHRTNVLQVRRDLDKHVREHLSRHEHEALLRHKLRAIKSELGEQDRGESDTEDLARRLRHMDLPQEVAAMVTRELGRLHRMNPQSSEASISRTYLECIADLPWGPSDRTVDKLDLKKARTLLDRDHYGLERVKKRIIEYLSVRKLAPNKRGPILCLAGPPGVGKTSLGRSIAEALGRRVRTHILGRGPR